VKRGACGRYPAVLLLIIVSSSRSQYLARPGPGTWCRDHHILRSEGDSEIQLVELDFDELLRARFIPDCPLPLPFLEFQQFPVLWVRSL
jgi:hypothetical protein